jgi:DNA-binding SARP family transcriptional activator/tetratricopeptide (TPR) repeat protein
MADGLTFGVLGPLEMRWHGELCRVGRPKARQLLATLLLYTNRFVATELLVDVLWGERQPRSATANLRSYLHEVRDACAELSGSSPIRTHRGGYSIEIAPDVLDLHRFQVLVDEVERLCASGAEARALPLAERAYGLWRGHPLDDLPIAPAWRGALNRIEHARREFFDLLAELWMGCGKYQRACGLLRERIEEECYAEHLWVRYITCLAESGKEVEARQAAREIRGILADDLGSEPGTALRRVEERLGESTVAEPAPTAARPASDLLRTPQNQPQDQPQCQLPLDVADFTGRTRELDRLRRLFAEGGRDRPLVAVLSGPPGVGKTALAVHLAHLLRAEFPDGQLFLDLRATAQPRDAASAIGELLYSLGAATPSELDRRAAMLRSALAGRRVLILLDDAASAEQVIPLLPGTGNSALLVTSRARLSDLASVTRCPVGELDDDDSATLLTRILDANRDTNRDKHGDNRGPLEPNAVRAILQACGRLPLAIRIAGSRLARRDDLTAAALATRLENERRRLDELRVGDLAVRTSADLSYRTLDDAATRLYHVLGLLGMGEVPAWLLMESSIGDDPEYAVDTLVEANLLQVVGTDTTGQTRFRIHDLLRVHAFERATERTTGTREQAQQDLVGVLARFLARSVRMAAGLPYRFLGVTVNSVDASLTKCAQMGYMPEDTPPVDWFDTHRHTHTPLVMAAAAHGADEIAWQLAASWAPYYDLRAHNEAWRQSHEPALACARRTGTDLAIAIVQRNRGQVALYLDDDQQAEACMRESYTLFAALPHESGAGMAALGLATHRRHTEDLDAAMHWYMVALEHFTTAEDLGGEATARSGIGGLWLLKAEPDNAERWLNDAVELALRTGDRHREALIRHRIATLWELRGDLAAAITELRAALDMLIAIGDQQCTVRLRCDLGNLLIDHGDLTTARRILTTALDVRHRLADVRGEAKTADRLARLHRIGGRPDLAHKYRHRARRARQQIGATTTQTGNP